MGVIHGVNRHDEILCPERLGDMVEAHPVRCIGAFSDHLNRTTLGFQRAKPAATGRPACHPAALLPLDIDGSLYRLRPRRRPEQGPHRDVELRWRLKERRPDHETIADFRKNTLAPRPQGCRTTPWPLAGIGVILRVAAVHWRVVA